MNLPITKPILTNVFLEKVKPSKLILDFSKNLFSGLIFITNDTPFGFEESYIIFDKGKIIGCIYLFDIYNIKRYGSQAFDYCLNCLGSKDGIIDIYELSEDQIKLILLFNEKIKFIKTINKKNSKKKNFFLNNLNYDLNKVKLILKDQIIKPDSQKKLLDERGLDDLLNL